MNGIFINEKRHMLINSFIKILENKYIAYVTLVSFFGNLFFLRQVYHVTIFYIFI